MFKESKIVLQWERTAQLGSTQNGARNTDFIEESYFFFKKINNSTVGLLYVRGVRGVQCVAIVSVDGC